MSTQGLEVRGMTRPELGVLLDFAAAEGWNPGLHDADTFFAADPEGFFVAIGAAGELLGGISAVTYGPRYGFIGLFIVVAKARGGQIGPALAEAAFAHLGDRIVGLDGVKAKQRQYEKIYGFQYAHRNVRYAGRGEGTVQDSVRPVSEVPFEKLLVFDSRYVPEPRPRFLRAWIDQPGAAALGVIGGDKELAAYGVVRPCRNGFKIGPLFSDTEADADSIFLALAAHAGDTDLYLDAPQSNPLAAELAHRYGFKPVFETARMYRPAEPELPLHEIYGITTFELG